jgi:branched-chain amino acid transport system permease protein
MGGSKMDIRTTVVSRKSTTKQKIAYAAIAFALVIAPILFQGFGQFFLVRIMALIGLYVMLGLGLNIVVGYAGLLDLGYIAFYAIGGYVGIIGATYIIDHLGEAWGPWTYYIMLPFAALAGAATGIVLGTPVLRLRGDYLAIVTLGFGEIVRIALNNNIFGLSNGAAGLPKAGVLVPEPAGLAWLRDHIVVSLPNLGANGFYFTFSNNLFWYFMIVLLCIVTIFVVRRLDDSRLGRSWTAMREDEVAASSVGVNIRNAKLWAFSLGAVWGGIAGITFANFQQFISPESFTFMESVFVVCIVVLGGMGSIPGVIVGAIVIQGVPELIRGLASTGLLRLTAEQASAVSNYRYLVFGLLMVIMMAVRPQGFIPSQRRAMELKPEDDSILGDENQTEYDFEHGTNENV